MSATYQSEREQSLPAAIEDSIKLGRDMANPRYAGLFKKTTSEPHVFDSHCQDTKNAANGPGSGHSVAGMRDEYAKLAMDSRDSRLGYLFPRPAPKAPTTTHDKKSWEEIRQARHDRAPLNGFACLMGGPDPGFQKAVRKTRKPANSNATSSKSSASTSRHQAAAAAATPKSATQKRKRAAADVNGDEDDELVEITARQFKAATKKKKGAYFQKLTA